MVFLYIYMNVLLKFSNRQPVFKHQPFLVSYIASNILTVFILCCCFLKNITEKKNNERTMRQLHSICLKLFKTIYPFLLSYIWPIKTQMWITLMEWEYLIGCYIFKESFFVWMSAKLSISNLDRLYDCKIRSFTIHKYWFDFHAK